MINIRLLLVCILSTTYFGAFSQTEDFTINEYGLKLITSTKQLATSVKNDSTQQLINLEKVIPDLKLEYHYATKNNFTNQILYINPKPYVRIEVAKKLDLVAKTLKNLGIGIIIYDAYRPYNITKKMWEIVPDDRYAANPANGSGHNRGAAIDVGLFNLKTGKVLKMPTKFDDFSEKAHHNYNKLSKKAKANRANLKKVMEENGFVALETEWWHYSLPNASKKYTLLDIDFKDL